jgi:SAM-dependent methyltransferase
MSDYIRYNEYTFDDPNPIKRLLQRRRIADALSCAAEAGSPDVIVDYGSGNGEFCKSLTVRFPEAHIYCFEPCPWLVKEAEENLAGLKNITIVSSVDLIPKGVCDLLCCNEVFEHFLPDGLEQAIGRIRQLLKKDALAVIGVPIEIFFPALYKGLFRMARRYGKYDARLSTVLPAVLGFPRGDRPITNVGPELPFHNPHLGFDYRVLHKRLLQDFTVVRIKASPIPWLGPFLNNELYFLLKQEGSEG